MNIIKRIGSPGLAARIIAIVVVVLVAVLGVNYVVFVDSFRASAEQSMVDKAAAFTATADAAKDYAATQLHGNDTFDKPALLAELEEVLADGRSYREAKIFNTIPVVVGWMAAEEAANREQIDFRVSAFEARNPE
ncbi:MAG: hypothetical protein AAGL98_11445, partial [Planctomycetota bacterium]